jgi:primosomal protein N' (replication factor Y)
MEVAVTSPVGERGAAVAQVVPLLRLRHLGDRVFDYLIPAGLSEEVRVGSVVRVPFARRMARAVVVALTDMETAAVSTLKEIDSCTGDVLPEESIALAHAVAGHYLSSFEAALRLVVPPSGLGQTRSRTKTWIVRTDTVPDKLTPKQRALLEAVPAGGGTARELCAAVDVGPGVLRALVRKGGVALCDPPAPMAGSGGPAATPGATVPTMGGGTFVELWSEQQMAVSALLEAYEEPGLARRLLWGITGSGKTEVYLRLIARSLEDGAGAILLVPEIALTPQMIARVKARFGERVGVLHSGLTPSQRLYEYRRIARGETGVVVGARSAVFAPVARLRLIIVDESHDGSYKQEEEPRYHAVTVAELRLQAHGGLLVEGSATPAVESYARREEHIRLNTRAAGSVPTCEAIDMRHQGGGQLLAPRTREAIADTLRRGEQAIVLLNRRGYAGHVHCDLCGHVMMCGECELSLTYHDREQRLVCHHCGRTYAQPAVCPACGQAPLTRSSPGTERLDRELRRLVPQEKVFRLDSDVLTSGTRVQRVLESFASTRPAVLVGTQMVAKGHDFADVTLVVVADADTGLYIPDFRAAEHTFQLLTQVAGRAGRAQKPGRVLVQTWNPEVPCIRMALQRDEEAFYSQELLLRKRLGYPPFTDLVRVVTAAAQPERAQAAARLLADRLGPYFESGELRGPARLPRLRGRSRWHLMIAAGDAERARHIVGQAMAQLREPYRRRGVTLLVDVDPRSFG